MDLVLENNIINNLENKQNSFLQSTIGKAINNGINVGLRALLPDFIEDKVIELKENLLNFGLKEGIDKTIKSAINTGKSAIGIITGNFENVGQINEAVRNGGIIDSVSSLLDDVLNKVRNAGKINNTAYNLIRNGKDSILSNVEKNIETSLTNQVTKSEYLSKYMNNWKSYYSKHDFNGMEREYEKIRSALKELVPIENTINEARNIQTLHKFIKNNGYNFNFSQEELDLVKKLNI